MAVTQRWDAASAAMAVLRAVFPQPAPRAKAMTAWGGLSVIGATAGNLLPGVVSALASWRLALAVPVAVGALALAPRLLPATPVGGSRSLDMPGALLATAGITLAGYGLVAAGTATTFVVLSLHLQQDRGWSALRTSAAFVPFAAALLAAGRTTGRLIARYGAPAVTALLSTRST